MGLTLFLLPIPFPIYIKVILFSLFGAFYIRVAYPMFIRISTLITGQVFIPIGELQNIWRQFDKAENEQQISAVLRKFAEKMVGTENVILQSCHLPDDQQAGLLKKWGREEELTDCFLSKEDRELYFSIIDRFSPNNGKPESKYTFIAPLRTRNSWFGHLAFTGLGRGLLRNREYRNILNTVVDQATSLIDKSRFLALAKSQSHNLQKLLDLSKNISSIIDLEKLLDSIIETLDDIIPFDAGGIFLIDDKYEYFYARKIRGYTTGDIDNLAVKLETGIIGRAIREKRTIVLGSAKTDSNYFQLRKETNSQLTTPLFVGDEVIGVFSLESNQLNYFEAQDTDYLDAFAGIAAVSIRNAKLYRDSQIKHFLETEMINAAQVQSALLPKDYPIPEGYDIHAINIPSLQVGGDIFDLGGSEDNYLVAIGDVSGKGTSGAILMAVLFAGIRSTLETQWEVRNNISQLNNLMVESTIPGKFATFFMAKLNADTDELWYSNAGYNAPLLYRKNGEYELLEEGGVVLGFIKDTHYAEARMKIESGDMVILFTDGLVEAMDSEDNEYGLERILAQIRKNENSDAAVLSQALLEDVNKWVGNTGLQDDLTLIVIRKK